MIAGTILDRDFQADRDFRVERPNQKWLAGFTCIWTVEGRLYVAARHGALLLNTEDRTDSQQGLPDPLWIACISPPIPISGIMRLIIWARTLRAMSLPPLFRLRVRTWLCAIQALRVPNGMLNL